MGIEITFIGGYNHTTCRFFVWKDIRLKTYLLHCRCFPGKMFLHHTYCRVEEQKHRSDLVRYNNAVLYTLIGSYAMNGSEMGNKNTDIYCSTMCADHIVSN